MRILVTGSRDWNDRTVIHNALLSISPKEGEQMTVINGGARGADWLAQECARALGYVVITHVADWDKYGKRAGYVRNQQMVDSGVDVCLAFIKNESKGATMCADLATKAGIPVRFYRENSEGI